MSEIQKGRPTIYGKGQSSRRCASRSGLYPGVAENQQKYAAGARRKTVYGAPMEGRDRQAWRVTERLDSAQMEYADRPVTENRVHTEQKPRRYAPGAGCQGAVPSERGRERYATGAPNRRSAARGPSYIGDVSHRRADAPTPAAYAVPSGRAARGREELPEEMRQTDFSSDRKLRALWSVFGILAVLLVAAIIYEVVLGNGLKETGNQRMAGQSGTQRASQMNAQTVGQTSVQTASQTNAQTVGQANAQTASQTNAQTTDQTNAASAPAADASSTVQTAAPASASTTSDTGTVDAAAGADGAAADDSADHAADGTADGSDEDAVDDIPTIPLEGDDAQADAAGGTE